MRLMNSWALASVAARMMSSRLAPGMDAEFGNHQIVPQDESRGTASLKSLVYVEECDLRKQRHQVRASQ